jgi:acyl-CoA synthetase (AMP-forming)/AMP-acid ligase II
MSGMVRATQSKRAASLASYPSVVHRMRWLAQHSPDAAAIRFLPQGTLIETELTCAALDSAARRCAASLRSAGLAGKRIVLMLPSGCDYLVAFLGCLYAGSVAVPSFPRRPNRHQDRLVSVLADSEPAAIVVPAGRPAFEGARELAIKAAAPALEVIDLDTLLEGNGNHWVMPTIGPDSLAILQYTSGSTSIPKGVMISHGNILHDIDSIAAALQPGDDTRGLSWLPLHHDMGLIGGALTPLCVGFPIYLMTPECFLMRPSRWLRAISEHRINWSVAPTFAYQYCVDRIGPEQRAGLDLSSWHTAIVGAEPIRQATLTAFSEAFGAYGFAERAFVPCYGLAEATLLVTGVERGAALRTSGTGIGCGRSWGSTEVRVVDANGLRSCAEREVGEIWVTGPNVTQGYWNRPEQTHQAFRARIAGDERDYLRTGDLGFFSDGELYVSGRLKNLLLVAGRNVHLEDVEATVLKCHPQLRSAACAAFAVDAAASERLVILVELDRSGLQREAAGGVSDAVGEIGEAIRQAVTEAHELAIHELLFARQWTIPRTSSGKIRHDECRRQFLDGVFQQEPGAGPQ